MRLSNLDGRGGVPPSRRQNRRAAVATDPVVFYRALAVAKGSICLGSFDLIHSVGSLELAEEIDRRARKRG